MADTIDTLQIQIESNAEGAYQGLDNFAASLRKVGNAFSRIDVGKVNSFASSLGTLSSSVSGLSASISGLDLSGLTNLTSVFGKLGNKGMQSATATIPFFTQSITDLINTLNGLQGLSFDPTGLTNLITAVSSLGGKKLGSAVNSLPILSQGITSLAASLGSIQGVNFDITGLAQLIDAMRALGSKNAQTAVAGLDQLGAALTRLMSTLSTAPQVSQNVIQLVQALAQLAAQGSRVGSASNTIFASLPKLNIGFANTQKRAFSLASAFGRLYATYWLVLRAIRGLKGWVDFASSLTEIQNVVNHTFGNMQGVLNDFAKNAIQSFGMSELSAKQAATRYQAMGVAMNLTNGMVKRANDNLSGLGKTVYNTNGSLADMSVNITKLVGDYASFFDMDQKEVAEKFNAIYTGQTRPLRAFGLDLTQATLQTWALNNGMNVNVQKMTQAEKTMLRYQYVMANSQHIMGDFARTSDRDMCHAA